MVNEGILSTEKFSVFLDGGEGHIDFGEPDASQIVDGDINNVVWFDQESNETHVWYHTSLDAIEFGEEEYFENGRAARYNYPLDSRYPVILSTGSNVFIAPDGLGWEILLRLTKDKVSQYIPEANIFAIECAQREDYEDIRFNVNEHWVQLRAEDYIGKTEGVCYIKIVPGWFPAWVFGTSVLEGYYTIFDNADHDDAKIGIAPHVNSDKDVLESGSFPTTSLHDIVWELTPIFEVYSAFSDLPVDLYPIFKILGNIWLQVFGV